MSKDTSSTEPSEKTDRVLYDRTSPNIAAATVTYKNKSGTTITGDYGYSATIANATATDSGSGVNTIEYKYNWGSSSNTWTTTKPSAPTTTGSYTLYVRATDKAGNVSDEKSTTIKIDQSDPSIKVTVKKVNGETTLCTKTDVKKINASDIKSTDNNWINADDGGVIFDIQVTDSGGAGYAKTEYEYNQTGSYDSANKNMSSGAVSDSSDGKVYKTLTGEGKRYCTFTAYDNVGNSSTVEIYVNIDRTKPSIDAATVTYKNKSGTTITGTIGYSATISTPTATDSGSGLGTREYSWDKNTWTTTKPSAPTTTDSKTLYVRATDKAGNVSDIKSTTINIDQTPPDIKVKISKYNDNSKVFCTKTNTNIAASDIKSTDNNWVNKSDGGVTNDVTVTDSGGAGYAKTVYAWNASGNSSSVSTAISDSHTYGESYSSFTTNVTGDGKRYYTFTAYDKVGNSRTVKVYANIDKTPPTYTYSISRYKKDGTSISSGWCYQAKVTVSTSDTGSGVSTREYKWNTSGSSYTSYSDATKTFTSPKSTTDDRRLYIRVTDKAGNVASSDADKSSTYASVKVDVTAPTVSISDTYSVNNHNRTFTISPADKNSGIDTTYNWYFASDVATENSNGIRAKEPASSKYTLSSSSSKSKSYTMNAGTLYAIQVEVFDKVGNSKKLSEPIYRYGPCTHLTKTSSAQVIGSYGPQSSLDNYSIQKYYFNNEKWDCDGDSTGLSSHNHTASYSKNAVYTSCQYCHVPCAYLVFVGGETGAGLSVRLWCEYHLNYGLQ